MGILKILPEYKNKKGWPWDTETSENLYKTDENWPKISIVTPSFNQGEFIEETLRSLLLQNYPDLELIIIDGGSTDNTISIIKQYQQWITYWVSEPDNGQTQALNKGFVRCKGEIIAYLNSDDYYENGTLFKVANHFKEDRVEIINGNCFYFWEGEGIYNFQKATDVTYEGLLKYWRGDVIPAQPSVFFRRKVLEKVGLPDEDLIFGMDVDMWIRMSRNHNFKKVDELYSYYRFHKASKTGAPGLFKKFRPEWHKLSQRELRNQTFTFKIRYALSRSFYNFRVWFYNIRVLLLRKTGLNIGDVENDNKNVSFLSFLNKKL